MRRRVVTRLASSPIDSGSSPVLVLAAFVLALACAGKEPPPGPTPTPPQRAARIAELRTAIAEDHAALQALASRPRDEREVPLHGEPGLLDLARRLDAHERELAEWLELETVDGAPGVRRR